MVLFLCFLGAYCSCLFAFLSVLFFFLVIYSPDVIFVPSFVCGHFSGLFNPSGYFVRFVSGGFFVGGVAFFLKYETKVINEGVKLIWIFWQDHTVSIHEINFVSLIRAFIFFSEGRLNNFVATPTELLFPFAPTMIIVMVDLVWLDNIKTLS